MPILVFSQNAGAQTAFGWGDNSARQLSFGTTSPFQTIAAGGFQTLLAQPDGSILLCGSPSNNIVIPPSGPQPIIALAAGYSHGLALARDGSLFAFGNNDHGQTTVPFGFTNFVAIGAGAYHSIGVLPDSTVITWGDNYQNHRTIPLGLSNVIAVAGGYYHSLALRSDLTIVAWGVNGDGQISVPTALSNVAAIAAGSFHSLALRTDGTVVAWGRNDHGQSAVPASASNVVAIAAGYQHSLALRSDGTVIAWGDNAAGQSAPPPTMTNAVAIAAGYQHSLALLGTPAWPAFEQMPVSIFTNIGANVSFNAPATASGAVYYQWQFNGQDLPGQNNPTLQLANVQPSDAGLYTLIASANGFFVSARAVLALENPVILQQPSSLTLLEGQPATFRISAISSLPLSYRWQFNGADLSGAAGSELFLPAVQPTQGGTYQVVMTTDWGSITSAPVSLTVLSPPSILSNPSSALAILNDTAQFSVGTIGTPPLRYQWFFNGLPVAAATNSTLALQASGPGGVYVLVTNLYGAQTSAVAQLEVTRQDNILAWGDNSYGETNIPPSIGGLSRLVCGTFRVIGLRTNGTLVAWGRNTFGETSLPSNLTNVTAISTSSHNLALKTDGTVASWGYGAQGQTNVPPGLSNVVAVSAGTAFSLALKSDGTVVAWGDNSHNQTNVPSNVSNIVAIAAGEYHAMALNSDGTVITWGQTNPAYHIPPAGLSNVVAIAAGYTHCLALLADGTLTAWGQNDAGQLSMPPGLSNIIGISAGGFDGLALRNDGTLFGLGDYDTPLEHFPPGLTNVSLFSVGVAVGAVQFGAPAWPVFSQIPVSQVASIGDTILLTAVVSTSYPVSYQWQFNGVNLPGLTNSTLALLNIQPEQSGAYRVIVRAGAFVVTATAQLGVDVPILVLSASTDQAVVNGTNVNLFVSAVANAPIQYQWKRDGLMMQGETNAFLNLTNVQTVNAGLYSVIVQAGATKLEVPAGRLTVKYPPIADPTPRNITADGGQTITLHPIVSGPGPFSYFWTGLGVTPDTATNADLVLTNVLYDDRYVLTIHNNDGFATNIILLTVLLAHHTVAEWDDFNDIFLFTQTNAVSISAGYQHLLAAFADGTVQSYGLNDFGQAAIPPGLQNVLMVAAGFSHSLALRDDGSVVGWGDNFSGQTTVPSGAAPLTAIAAGKEYSLGLRADGTLFAWGDNSYGQTNFPAIPGVVLSMSAGYHHALALLMGGHVVGWGENSFGQAAPPPGLNNVVAVSAGGLHSLALISSGQIVAWGDDTYGQIQVPASATNIIGIAAGYAHNLALRADGTVVRWGRGANVLSNSEVPDNVAHVSAIAAGYTQCVVATPP